jgi:hypothetical protein
MQRDEVRVTREPVFELGRDRNGQPGLPGPSRARQRHEPNPLAVDGLADLLHLPRAPDQHRRIGRQIRPRAETAQRGMLRLEAGSVDVEEVLRFRQVLQSVPSEVSQLEVGGLGAHQLLCGGGQHDLVAVGGPGDPGSPVDVDADVVVLVPFGFTRMQPDPHSQRHLPGPLVLAQTSLGLDRCPERLMRRREDDEEAVALRPHLTAVVCLECGAQDPPLRGQRFTPARPKAVQQRGRSLDVAEQHRQCPRRQRAHGDSMPFRAPSSPVTRAADLGRSLPRPVSTGPLGGS